MIPIEPRRPLPPTRDQIKINSVKRVEARDESLSSASERRKKGDRRKTPFKHRGPYEMRSGVDRRDPSIIDDEA